MDVLVPQPQLAESRRSTNDVNRMDRLHPRQAWFSERAVQPAIYSAFSAFLDPPQ